MVTSLTKTEGGILFAEYESGSLYLRVEVDQSDFEDFAISEGHAESFGDCVTCVFFDPYSGEETPSQYDWDDWFDFTPARWAYAQKLPAHYLATWSKVKIKLNQAA